MSWKVPGIHPLVRRTNPLPGNLFSQQLEEQQINFIHLLVLVKVSLSQTPQKLG
jgi:hypothetical protein